MGKYHVKEPVAVQKGNKVTVYNPSDSDEWLTFDDGSVKDQIDKLEKHVDPEAESVHEALSEKASVAQPSRRKKVDDGEHQSA